VHPTGGSLRIFEQFAWLGVVSVKAALSRPAHQRVTQAVSRLIVPTTSTRVLLKSFVVKVFSLKANDPISF
jgi:hypothetical protein